MSDPKELNKRKQEFLRLNGVKVKVDGSWGPWQEEQYKKLTTKDKHYQTTPLGALSYLYDKTFGSTTYQEDPDYVKGYSGELTEDTRSAARRWVDTQMKDNKTPLGYAVQTVAPAAAVAAATVYGGPVLVNGVTKGAPLLWNGARTAVTNPSTIMPAIKTGANAGLQLGKTLGKEALKAGVGMAAVNGASKVTTGKTWGENVAQSTGMSHELAEWTNPGAYGPTYLKNVAKRGLETAIRTTTLADPIPEIQKGMQYIITEDPKRALSIGNYILTGTRIGNKGYYNSLAKNPAKYNGGISKNLNGNDIIDAFLYRKPIDSRYGLTQLDTKDYGVYSGFIKDTYPNKNIAIYEVEPPKSIINPPEELIPRKHPLPDNYKVIADESYESSVPFFTKTKHTVHAHDNVVEEALNNAGRRVAERHWNIKNYNPELYNEDLWSTDPTKRFIQKSGLQLLDRLGNPVIIKTKWFTPVHRNWLE